MNSATPAFAAGLTFMTSRACVRPLAAGDEALYCRIYGDAETLRHVGEALEPRRALRSFAAALRQTHVAVPPAVYAVAMSRDDGRELGICGLRDIDVNQRRAETGILLAAFARGQGLGCEILSALVRHGFEHLPLDEIYLTHSPDNAAMSKLARSAGFMPDAEDPTTCRLRRDAF